MVPDHITAQTLTYTAPDGQTLTSWLYQPKQGGQQGAVLIAPEWWGLTDYPKSRAVQLAELGYSALAMDIYGDGRVTSDAKQAGAWMGEMLADQDKLLARAEAGFNALKTQAGVDANKIAAIGYCFGGKIVLDMARAGLPLAAVASFHGNLSPRHQAARGQVKAELLIEHGGSDTMVSMDDLKNFEQEMTDAQATYTVHVYPEAKHAFTNPAADLRAAENGVDLSYDEQADRQSFEHLKALLARKIG